MSKGPLPAGKGAACLTCKGICPGFQPHSWRKACVKCQCSQDEHTFISNNEDDLKVGRLLADSRYTHLTAKVKGGDGTRVYKRNRMIVTNPVVSRKDPTFNTVTYDWAPTGLTQKLAMLYMSLLPEERRPVAGTEGSLYRHKQLTRQLPAYDHDPAYCHSLSEAELKVMAQFVKSYKEESLGVGEVALPGEKSTTKRNEKISQEHTDPPLTEQTPDGAIESPVSNETEYYCSGCGQLAAMDEPVVYADRAGYERLWHPACFVCGECGEALVDLIYFWKEGALLCGRHYCQSIRPRCLGCDELIFSDMLLQEASGHVWHKEHFCCWLCGQDIRVECGCDKRQTT